MRDGEPLLLTGPNRTLSAAELEELRRQWLELYRGPADPTPIRLEPDPFEGDDDAQGDPFEDAPEGWDPEELEDDPELDDEDLDDDG